MDRPSLPSRFAIRLIEVYRSNVSQMVGAHCRFEPTCSQYGLEAFQSYGFLQAGGKTAWRIVRCNPLNRGPRFDPP